MLLTKTIVPSEAQMEIDETVLLLIDLYLDMYYNTRCYIDKFSCDFNFYTVEGYIRYGLSLIACGSRMGVIEILLDHSYSMIAKTNHDSKNYAKLMMQLSIVKRLVLFLHNGNYTEFIETCRCFSSESSQMTSSFRRIREHETKIKGSV